MTPRLRKMLFETLYKHRYLYRFASTVPFAGQWRVWQRLVLPRLQGHDVLEFGCGLGDLLADMAHAGYACYAVEQSPEMVQAARDTLKRHHLERQAAVIFGSAQHVPFSDEAFDTIVSTFPSEYIYDDDTIAEAARVLRPGGRLIVVEGANLLPTGFLQPFLVLIQMLVYGPPALFGQRKQRTRTEDGEEDEDMPNTNQQPHLLDSVVRTNRETGTGTTTQVLSNAAFGQHIPLEHHGLRRRSELVRNRRWEAYITIGEKTTGA
jgi:ubiquinone/menaquinone biosynthesis C-methylase UbiE